MGFMSPSLVEGGLDLHSIPGRIGQKYKFFGTLTSKFSLKQFSNAVGHKSFMSICKGCFAIPQDDFYNLQAILDNLKTLLNSLKTLLRLPLVDCRCTHNVSPEEEMEGQDRPTASFRGYLLG